jgi:hypothetical protein
MKTYKNTRPTIIQLPNGHNVGPGATFESDPGVMENPGMRKFCKAGYIVEVKTSEPPPPPEAPKAPTPKAEAPKEAPAKPVVPPEAAAMKAAQDKAKAEKAAQVVKDAAEKAAKAKRDAKVKAVKEADAEGLLKLAEGETDSDVNDAIQARAAELAPKG